MRSLLISLSRPGRAPCSAHLCILLSGNVSDAFVSKFYFPSEGRSFQVAVEETSMSLGDRQNLCLRSLNGCNLRDCQSLS